MLSQLYKSEHKNFLVRHTKFPNHSPRTSISIYFSCWTRNLSTLYLLSKYFNLNRKSTSINKEIQTNSNSFWILYDIVYKWFLYIKLVRYKERVIQNLHYIVESKLTYESSQYLFAQILILMIDI